MGSLRKRESWKNDLYEAYRKTSRTVFEFGKFDCCTGVAILVEAMTGYDFRLDFPTYSTKEGAFALERDLGGLPALVDGLEIPRVPVSRMTEGDVVYAKGIIFHEGGDIDGMGMVALGGQAIWFPGRRGWNAHDLEHADIAWRIPD